MWGWLMVVAVCETVLGVAIVGVGPAITQQIAGFLLIGFGIATFAIAEVARHAKDIARRLGQISLRLAEIEAQADKRMGPIAAAAARINALGKE